MTEQPPWQPPQQSYPHPGYPPPQYGPEPPATTKAITALVLGIVGLTACVGIASIPAWVIGHQAVREIDASKGALGGRSLAMAGKIMGIIGSILGGLIIAFVIVVFAFGALITTTYNNTCDTVTDGSGYTTTNC